MVMKKSEPAESSLNREDIERLIEVIHTKGVQEFELEQGGMRLRIVSGHSPAPIQVPPSPPSAGPHLGQLAPIPSPVAATSSAPQANPDEDPRFKKVTSPMVGTFYRSSSPGVKPFVEVGDKVDEDSVLCIIEAMKLMNEIKAEMRGVVRKVLVENATPVEYGQAMYLVEPE